MKKILTKIRLRTYIGLMLIIILLPIVLFTLFKPDNTNAQWWNEDWKFRKAIPLTNNTTAEASVYIAFDGTAGHANLDSSALDVQADCGDLRFTKQNGAPLPYIYNSGCTTSSTDIDIFFDSFPAGSQTIYMYYGNSSSENGTVSSAFTTEATNYTIGTLGSEEIGPGPVAYWKLDEGVDNTCSGGSNDICDSSSNGNDGTKTNAIWETKDLCLSGNCTFHDGTGDYMSIPDSSLFSPANSDFTASIWLKVPIEATASGDNSCGSTGKYFLSKGADVNDWEWAFENDNNTSICINMWQADGTGHGSIQYSMTVNDGMWHHYLFTYDLSTPELKLYIDGQLINNATGLIGSLSDTNSALEIGSRNSGSETIEGFIDEVKIYNYIRTAAQIKSDYNHYANTLGTNTQSWLNNGLIGYWKLDESSGNATDTSGNGVTLTNNGVTTYLAGKFGNGSEHVPASSQYLSTATTVSGVQSISFWTNPDSTTNYFISLTSSAYVTASSGTLSATGFADPTIYVNGQVSSTITANTWQLVTVTTDTAINANQLYVGRQATNYYDGTLDEIRLYSRVLSEKEIKDLYNWAPGPTLYLPMNENNGTSTVYDRSGNSNNATMYGTMTQDDWVTGKYGSALNFDGTDDRLEVANADAIDWIDSDKNWSVSAWMYYTSLPSNDYLIKKDDWAIYLNPYGSNDISFTQRSGAWQENRSVASVLVANTWQHLVVTGAGDASTIKMYLNGKEITNETNSFTWDGVAGNLQIADDTTTNYYAGVIDEVKFFNYTLNSKQIIEDMNAGHPTGGSPIGSQVIYYKFDEQYGTTAHDSVGSQDGTVDSNLTWLTSTSCKYNGCLQWDASGEEVSIATANDAPVDFNSTESFSGSAWIYITTMPTSTSSDKDAIIAKYDETNTLRGYRLYVENDDTDTTGNAAIEIYDETNNQALTATSANDSLNQNTWYHLVWTFNGGTSGTAGDVKLYINGQFKGQNPANASFAGVADVASDFTIGEYDPNDTVAGNTAFTGNIDEVKIYNSELTANQIKIDYSTNSAINFSTGQTEANNLSDGAGNPPIAYWNFDENTGTSSIYDKSGNNYTGTLNSITENAWVPGKYGSSLDFDGTADYITASPTLPTGDFTYEAWVWINSSDVATYETFFDAPTNTPGNANELSAFVYPTAAGSVDIHINGAYVGNANIPITSYTWHHLAVVRSGANIYIYLDGTSYTLSGTDSTTLNFGACPFFIGSDIQSDCTATPPVTRANYFPGKIDDFKIYNYARTQAQISYDYNRGAPVGYWKFDECEGSTAHDSTRNKDGTITSGSGTIGTCTGSTGEMWHDGATGKRNASLDFNSAETEYVNIGDTGFTSIRSVAFWAKPDTTTEELLQLSATDTVQVSSGTMSIGGFGTETVYIDGAQSTSFPDTDWHHVVVVSDADLTANAMYITRISTNYGDGLIDDVQIYSYSLSASQVKNIYNQSAIRFGPATGSP